MDRFASQREIRIRGRERALYSNCGRRARRAIAGAIDPMLMEENDICRRWWSEGAVFPRETQVEVEASRERLVRAQFFREACWRTKIRSFADKRRDNRHSAFTQSIFSPIDFKT